MTPSITPSLTRTPDQTGTTVAAQATIDQLRRQATATQFALQQQTQIAAQFTQTAFVPTLTALAFTATPAATLTPIPTAVPPPTVFVVPTLPPAIAAVPTAAPPPTLDATPVFITATPGGEPIVIPSLTFIPPTAEDALPIFGPASPTSQPPTSLPIPTAITLAVNVPNIPQIAGGLNTTFSFALTTDGITGARFALSGGAWRFSLNPQTGTYARVDGRGTLFVNAGQGDGGQPLTGSPFTPFGGTLEENNAPVGQVAWSPDGRYLAYLVDTELDAGTANDANSDDGLWYYDPAAGGSFPLLRDCRPTAVCLVNVDGEPQQLRSTAFQWNFASNAILVQLTLPTEGDRAAFTVVTVPDNAAQRRRVHRYDSAAWSIDNQTIIASGTSPSGAIGVFRVNPADGGETVLFDAGSRGLWVQDAIETLDGRLFMLGTAAGRGSPVALYDGRGVALTGPIGTTAPVRVAWSPNRTAVLVVTADGRHFLVGIGGGTPREIPPDQVDQVLAVEWLPSGVTLPQAQGSTGSQPAPAVPPTAPPPPVTLNAQAVIVNPAGLNVRSAPSTGADNVGRAINGVTVQIIGGPQDAEGYRWWQIVVVDGETAGISGWAVEAVGGVVTLQSR